MEEATYEPPVTLLIAAYNEAAYVEEKIANCDALLYPADKLDIVFVTDGSDDGTPELLQQYPRVKVLHEPGRSGKIAAVNRAMAFIRTPLVVFTDANTMICPGAIRNIVRHFEDPGIGAVAGEKRIQMRGEEAASGAGEGLYWRYESALKKMDSDLHSVVGAAGELFAIRASLYEPVERDTLIEDFVMTLRIAQKGYRVVYEPDAYAFENPSASIGEELKRKVRISAGGFQAIVRLKGLLNPLRYGVLSFEYFSHRVLRWAVAPFLLPLVFAANLALMTSEGGVYTGMFAAQIFFYLLAALGWILQAREIKLKIAFVPLYFLVMNVAAFIGLFRFLRGSQSVLWERARRA